MIITHNLAAMNAHKQMGLNSNIKTKSMEKLSSGLRINRADDAAAGLAISEKMRAQIRGLNQASRNVQDAISLIQTAEGGLNETQSILHRIREISVQAANDTNTTMDREAIQAEIGQLTDEIDIISISTEFNTRKLLTRGSNSALNKAKSEINTKVATWINDAIKTVTNQLGIDPMKTKSDGSKRNMNVEYINDVSNQAVMSMGATTSPDTDLTLRINLAHLLNADGSIKPENEFDTVIAHEMTHAYQNTNMQQIMNLATESKGDLIFIEGMAQLVQGGNERVAAQFGSAANNTGTSLGIGNHSSPSGGGLDQGGYIGAYFAMRILHEATNGGINAIIDRLEAGDSID